MLETILVTMTIILIFILVIMFIGMVDLYNAISHLQRIDKLLKEFENDYK